METKTTTKRTTEKYIEIRIGNELKKVTVPDWIRANFETLIEMGNRTRIHWKRYSTVKAVMSYAYEQAIRDMSA